MSSTSEPFDSPPPPPITQWIEESRQGNAEAKAKLWEAIYDQVRKISTQAMARESRPLSMAATDIAHEAFVKIAGAEVFPYENRSHLLATIARAIRRLLVDHARAKRTAKRGNGWKREDFDMVLLASQPLDDRWIDLDEALGELEAFDARLAQLVELRFFGGMTLDEAADTLGLSRRTIANDWALARAWLRRKLESFE